MKKKLLIIIAGPTAVGKTSVAIQLANQYNCPIISFDSRQFYTEMSIGTAKPTKGELDQAEHHFINSHSIQKVYTAGMYETEALELLDKIFQTNDFCIAVGGSGLYINALCYGIDEIPTSTNVRDALIERWKNEGLEALQNEVALVDPIFFNAADMKNPRRVIRALEVFQVSGKPYSHFRKNQSKERDFETIWIGLNLDRDVLFERINTRVDQMITNGLIDEVKSLAKFQELKALKTVGYQELFDYLNGSISLDKSIELIKRNSRNYAKKQLVWFKKNDELQWLSPFDAEEIITRINEKFVKINF